MKKLLVLLILTMLSHTCMHASTTNLQDFFASDPEAQNYVREGLTTEEKEIIKKINDKKQEEKIDAFGDDKKSVSTISDCITFSGNVLTSLCSSRTVCIAFCCTLTVYCIFASLTHGIEYCSQSFPDADHRCIDLKCLAKSNILDNYSICQKDRACWRENRNKYNLCLDDECAYAQGYCDNTMALCLAAVIMPFVLLAKKFYRAE